MKLDPRKLKPTQLCRIVNGTPLGEVLTERQLLRHRNRAGSSIGDLSTVDMFRYLGWTIQKRHAPRPEADELSYEKMKAQARNRNIQASIEGRDIGELPLKWWGRSASARRSSCQASRIGFLVRWGTGMTLQPRRV